MLFQVNCTTFYEGFYLLFLCHLCFLPVVSGIGPRILHILRKYSLQSDILSPLNTAIL